MRVFLLVLASLFLGGHAFGGAGSSYKSREHEPLLQAFDAAMASVRNSERHASIHNEFSTDPFVPTRDRCGGSTFPDASELDKFFNAGVVRVGVFYPSSSSTQEENFFPTAVTQMILDAINDYYGTSLELEFVDAHNHGMPRPRSFQAGLHADKFDLAFGLHDTPENRELIQFGCEHYAEVGTDIITCNGSPTPTGIAGLEVSCQRAAVCEQVAKAGAQTTIYEPPGLDAFAAFLASGADYYVVSSGIAEGLPEFDANGCQVLTDFEPFITGFKADGVFGIEHPN